MRYFIVRLHTPVRIGLHPDVDTFGPFTSEDDARAFITKARKTWTIPNDGEASVRAVFPPINALGGSPRATRLAAQLRQAYQGPREPTY